MISRLYPASEKAIIMTKTAHHATSRIAFADESGTDGRTKCYAIGVVSVARNRLAGFNDFFFHLAQCHGIVGEVHWAKVDKGHGFINLCLDWLHAILSSVTCRFDAIVVNTAQYRKWGERQANRETAFYTTYTQLLKHIVRESKETAEVVIDERSDRYPKHHEAVQTIGNRMLAHLNSTGRLESVNRASSRDYPGIQVADILTGAIRSSHVLRLDPTARVNKGKRLAIERMSQVLGWDALHYDTMPDSRFNIWHFPIEYRADPETKTVPPRPSRPVYVRPNDLR